MVKFLGRYIASVALLFVIQIAFTKAQTHVSNAETDKVLSWGDVFEQAGNDKKAIELYKEAILTAKTSKEVWNASDKLANLYKRKNRYNDILKLYDNILMDDNVRKDTSVLISVYDALGKVYYSIGNYIKSIKSYDYAKKLMEESHLMHFRSILNADIAWTLLKAGDAKEAERLLLSAEKEGLAKNDYHLLQDVYDALSVLYENNGDYEMAYKALAKHVENHHKENSGIISNLKNSARHTVSTKDAEDAIRYENAYKEVKSQYDEELLKNKKAKNRSYYMGVASLLLLAMLVWLMLLNSKKNKQMKKLTQSNDERQVILSQAAKSFEHPFNQLICFAEIQMQYASSVKDKDLLTYSRSMYNSSQQLYIMLGNVLAWAQLDSKHPLVKTSVNVAFKVERAVELCRMMAEAKGIQLSVDLDDSMNVLVNEVNFDTVIMNVLYNALVFTKKGGRVNISVSNERTTVIIRVEDTGVGMTASRVDEIMSNKQVTPTAGTANEKGMGLGLYICQNLLEVNGGYLHIKSIPDRGTIVDIAFPKGE
ncbi:MAG: ATP-binding protein [Bacteroidia bacterium]|nr:ATP-binding protein [Bacteroidia bacterium]